VAVVDHASGLSAIRGQLIDPSHAEYDLARAVYNGMIDRRPALIVRPLDAADVCTAIEFARSAGLPLAVRGGGHSVAGHSVCDDGVVIDLRRIRDVHVDPVARTAEAGGGATWNDLDAACQRQGLATPGGTFGTTGIGGLTLGGGLGHLMGRFGLTLDNLVRAEVVTAAGEILVADEENSSDLFWALRGGGGNFGVVTRFVYRLHELRGLAAGGLLIYDFARAGEVLRRAREIVDGTPDELTSFFLFGRDGATGERYVAVTVCWTGSSDDARARLDAFRAIPGLIKDDVRPMSYLQLQGIFGEIPLGVRNYWKGHFVNELADDLIDFLVEHFARRATPIGTILMEPVQGYATRVPDDATAFANRRGYNVTAVGVWLTPDDDETEIAWSRACAEGIAPFSSRGGGYLNYMGRDEPLERVEAAFGAGKFARLQEIKSRYDPDNVFRQNQNIPPAIAP